MPLQQDASTVGGDAANRDRPTANDTADAQRGNVADCARRDDDGALRRNMGGDLRPHRTRLHAGEHQIDGNCHVAQVVGELAVLLTDGEGLVSEGAQLFSIRQPNIHLFCCIGSNRLGCLLVHAEFGPIDIPHRGGEVAAAPPGSLLEVIDELSHAALIAEHLRERPCPVGAEALDGGVGARQGGLVALHRHAETPEQSADGPEGTAGAVHGVPDRGEPLLDAGTTAGDLPGGPLPRRADLQEAVGSSRGTSVSSKSLTALA